MSVLARSSVGYLRRHPWQFVLAVLGICTGVAVIVAVDLANESARTAFRLSMASLNGQATHQVIGGPSGVDEQTYTSLRTDGFTDIAPVVAGYGQVGDRSLQLLGIDVFAERSFRTYTAPASVDSDIAGSGSTEAIVRGILVTEGGVLMSARSATALGVGTEEAFEILVGGRTYPARLVGVLDSDDRSLDDILVVDIATAQHWLRMAGQLSRIDVRLDPNDPLAEARMASRLPDGAELVSASSRTQATLDMSEAFMTNLSAMSLLALLVGLFLIYNSMAFAVLQRRDLIGVLRALGVTRRETAGLIMSEALALGVLASALGIAVGIWLGDQLVVLVARTISDHYFRVTVTDVQAAPLSILKGVLAGVGTTCLAAAVPAAEASSYRPRLALSRSVLERRAGRWVSRLMTIGVALLAGAMMLVAVSGTSLVAGLVALFMLILGFSFCIPLAIRGLSGWLAPLAGRGFGASGRLAVAGIGASLSRTGVAIVALSVAVSATIGVSIMVGSFRVSVDDWLGNTLQSDVYVGVPRGSLEPALIDDIRALAGVAAVSTSRRAWLESASGRVQLMAIEMAPGSYQGTRLRHADPDVAWRQFDDEGAVMVSDSYAYRTGTSAGDRIPLKTSRGDEALRVAAVYQSYDANGGAIMMSRTTYDRWFDDPRIDSIGLYLEAGYAPDDIMAEVRRLGAGRQALIMNSNERIRALSLGIFDRTFVITNVLYWLAVGVAVIGILGAMLAFQLERSKEFGILRALGMTPGQTGFLVTAQTATIGLLAGLAALPLGLVMAWVLIEVINRRAFGWQIDMTVTAAPLGWAIVIAVTAALAGGLVPAWRAGRVPPALAMREE
jgi:putative ABC transport system permease protein